MLKNNVNNNILKFIGGAKVGTPNITRPFATLTVYHSYIKLNASIYGTYIFLRKDILEIKRFDGFLSKGIQIRHTVDNYNQRIIFWTFGDVNSKIRAIIESDFYKQDSENEDIIPNIEKANTSPFKKAFLIFLSVIWLLFFLTDAYQFISGMNKIPIGKGAFTVFVTFSIIATLLLSSTKFQSLVLNGKDAIRDLRTFILAALFLAIFLSLLIGFTTL